MRLFLMRFFHWNVDQFENVWNPENGAMWVLERVNPVRMQHCLKLYGGVVAVVVVVVGINMQ